MRDLTTDDIEFVDADAALVACVRDGWGEWAAREMHVDNGFSIVAIDAGKIVGLISLRCEELPAPLPATIESCVLQ